MGSIAGFVKQSTIKLVYAASLQRTRHEGVRTKAGWQGIRIMCQGGATSLPVDCLFSELAL